MEFWRGTAPCTWPKPACADRLTDGRLDLPPEPLLRRYGAVRESAASVLYEAGYLQTSAVCGTSHALGYKGVDLHCWRQTHGPRQCGVSAGSSDTGATLPLRSRVAAPYGFS